MKPKALINIKPDFSPVANLESAKVFLEGITRMIGPGFHPEEDFRNYVNPENIRCFTDEVADDLNRSMELVYSVMGEYGIDPCDVAHPIQMKMIHK